MSATPPGLPTGNQAELLALAGSTLERHLAVEFTYPTLLEVTKVSPQCLQTASGLNNLDYVNLESVVPGLSQVQTIARIPLPREVTEHARASHFHSLRGLFPEIRRAWITIDSDLYVWTYEQASDTAYYDRLTETIVAVALVKPRVGVFQSFVRYLLILCTSLEVVILGVTLQQGQHGELVSLLPEPVYQIPAEGIVVTAMTGTPDGRIFQGAEDGCLYEITYQGNEGWFGKNCKRVNHSRGALSFLVPSFLDFSDRDPICQLEVDSSRGILYVLTRRGTIRAYLLGDTPGSVCQFASVSEASLVQQALNVVRTLDSSHFKPIVALQVVSKEECTQLHLVAVTSAGVRLYFTTLSWAALTPNSQATIPQMAGSWQPSTAPQTLSVVHVRLPPGYSAQAHTQPHNVSKVLCKRGTSMMISGNTDRTTIYCLSRDLFPATPYFAETETQLQTDAQVFAVSEVPTRTLPGAAIVTQHMEQPSKFLTLTTQGVQIHSKLRPSDVLKAALLGPDPVHTVKSFFGFLGDEQACALALQLACLDGSTNPVVTEAATRAFIGCANNPSQIQQQVLTPPIHFNPHSASTPVSSSTLQINSTSRLSARHEGLCLYLSRVLRPLWSAKAAVLTEAKVLAPGADGDLLGATCTYLDALRLFLARHAPIMTAESEERRSVLALRTLASHAREVLGLWRVLGEHQFHLLVARLTKDQQARLSVATFREVVLGGPELCLALLSALVATYLEDSACVDALSAKLREVCPALFRQEDAAGAKARELLIKARDERDPSERSRLLSLSLDLLRRAVPHVDLAEACQHFAACKYPEGVVKLTVECADIADPQNAALRFYTNGEQASDSIGAQSYARRMDCYKHAVASLEKLYEEDVGQARMLLRASLIHTDPLLHIAIYEWLVRRGKLQSELLQRHDHQAPVQHSESPECTTLEGYLDRLATRNPADRSIAELLWTLYEQSGRHLAAAQVLRRVATSPGEQIPLEERAFCLSRAVLCMKSEDVGYSHAAGEVAHELEELYDVTRLQLKVLEQVRSSMQSLSGLAMAKLSNSLLSLTELYEDFALPLGLYETQIDILHLAACSDEAQVMEVWQNMFSSGEKVSVLLDRVEILGKRYGSTSIYVPLEYVTKELELASCKQKSEPGLVPRMFLRCGMMTTIILASYLKLATDSDWVWVAAGNELHLIDVLAVLVNDVIDRDCTLGGRFRREELIACMDLVTNCLTGLYTKPNEQARVDHFRQLQQKCERLMNKCG